MDSTKRRIITWPFYRSLRQLRQGRRALRFPAAMRLLRRIIWFCFLLLWLCAAMLWGRSSWKTDDLLLTYDGDGWANLRICRGIVTFIHASPKPVGSHHAIQRVQLLTATEKKHAPEMVASSSYVTHQQWLNFKFDSITSAQIASIQTAHAARVLRANQAAFAAAHASDLATMDFEDALAWADRRASFTERENVATAYWRMQAARQHATAMREAKIQIAATSVPALTPRWQATFPVWSLLVFASVPLAIPLLRMLGRRRRIRQGLCGACGYDLHGNTSGICPECGTCAAVTLCRSITVDGKRVLSITPETAIRSR